MTGEERHDASPCGRCLDRLDEWRRNELSAGESRQVEEHLSSCQACAEQLAVAEQLSDLLTQEEAGSAIFPERNREEYFLDVSARVRDRIGKGGVLPIPLSEMEQPIPILTAVKTPRKTTPKRQPAYGWWVATAASVAAVAAVAGMTWIATQPEVNDILSPRARVASQGSPPPAAAARAKEAASTAPGAATAEMSPQDGEAEASGGTGVPPTPAGEAAVPLQAGRMQRKMEAKEARDAFYNPAPDTQEGVEPQGVPPTELHELRAAAPPAAPAAAEAEKADLSRGSENTDHATVHSEEAAALAKPQSAADLMTPSSAAPPAGDLPEEALRDETSPSGGALAKAPAQKSTDIPAEEKAFQKEKDAPATAGFFRQDRSFRDGSPPERPERQVAAGYGAPAAPAPVPAASPTGRIQAASPRRSESVAADGVPDQGSAPLSLGVPVPPASTRALRQENRTSGIATRRTASVRDGDQIFAKAEAAQAAGRYGEAAQLYQRASELAPASRTAALSQMRLGDVSREHLNDHGKARDAYSACLRSPLKEYLRESELEEVRARLQDLR